MKVRKSKSKKLQSFRDFVNLRSGRDEFSSLTIDKLVSRVDYLTVDKINESFDSDADRAKALRWILRNLPVELAVRKVRTDLEVAQNAIKGKSPKSKQKGDDYDFWSEAFA